MEDTEKNNQQQGREEELAEGITDVKKPERWKWNWIEGMMQRN